MVGGGSFHLPHDLFHSTLLYDINFSSHVTICFKNGMFLLQFSRESHAEIQSRSVFFLNLCGTQTSKGLHNQTGAKDFQCLIWVFWVCRLSPTWHNVDCSQLMSQFDCYQLQMVIAPWGALSSKKSPAQNFANHFWQGWCLISHSSFSIHCTNLFFFFEVVFPPFLK